MYDLKHWKHFHLLSVGEFPHLWAQFVHIAGGYAGGGGCPVGVSPLDTGGVVLDPVFVGHWNDGPDMIMSLIRVSIGVLPTRRTKNSCSITWDDTVLKEGNLRSRRPKRVGWLGYWVLQYSSRAHCDFSCICSMIWTSVSPGASANS